jgi:hypothetical protein
VPTYTTSPTMAAFLESNARVRIVKGPFGSGKSSGCVIDLPRRAQEQAPGPDRIRRTRFAVVRNTYRELEDTTRATFEQWIPDRYGEWDEKNFTFLLQAKGVESEILFRALDKPKDVKKLLSLELTGAYVNEVREIPKAIVDGLLGRIGRYPSMKDGGPTWSGLWGDTNPWHTGHWGNKLFGKPDKTFTRSLIPGTPRPCVRLQHQLGATFELYTQPGGLDPDAENLENLSAGYYPLMCAGKDQEWIDVYVQGKDAVTDKGSVYGALIDRLDQAGHVAIEFEHPLDGVFTFWDLGIGDACSIWFFRIAGDTVDFIDHYENSGHPFSHYADVVDQRGYAVAKHWLPHDARNRTFVTGASVQQQAKERFGAEHVSIGFALSLADGIAAGRWLLERKPRFHARCDDKADREYSGLEALREYRYEWDDDTKTFSRVPLHNWASHSADAFRGVACVVKVSKLISERLPDPTPAPVIIKPVELKLDDLWKLATRKPRERIG